MKKLSRTQKTTGIVLLAVATIALGVWRLYFQVITVEFSFDENQNSFALLRGHMDDGPLLLEQGEEAMVTMTGQPKVLRNGTSGPYEDRYGLRVWAARDCPSSGGEFAIRLPFTCSPRTGVYKPVTYTVTAPNIRTVHIVDDTVVRGVTGDRLKIDSSEALSGHALVQDINVDTLIIDTKASDIRVTGVARHVEVTAVDAPDIEWPHEPSYVDLSELQVQTATVTARNTSVYLPASGDVSVTAKKEANVYVATPGEVTNEAESTQRAQPVEAGELRGLLVAEHEERVRRMTDLHPNQLPHYLRRVERLQFVTE